MADLNALHRYPYYRQRPVLGMSHSIGSHAYAGGSGQGVVSAPLEASHTTEMAYEYDQSLRQSRIAAIRRRGGFGMGGLGASVANMSTLLATGPTLGASVFSDPTNVPSVTLGDSHHASQELPGGADPTASSKTMMTGGGTDTEDEGVGSGLGESYIDGGRQYGGGAGEEEEEAGVEDVGVLGLLAQIYGRRDGPPVVL